jgi:hypothetical protein
MINYQTTETQHPPNGFAARADNFRPPLQTPRPEPDFSLTEVCNIAPLNAFCFVVVDQMLFGGELATGMVLAIVSVFVAGALVIPATIVQHYVSKDPWPLGFAKAACLAVLTAIPSGLGSVAMIGVTLIGVAQRSRARRTITVEGQDVTNPVNHDHPN